MGGAQKEQLVGESSMHVKHLMRFLVTPQATIAVRNATCAKSFYWPSHYMWIPFDMESSFQTFFADCSGSDVLHRGWSGFLRSMDLEKVTYAVTR